MNCEDEKIIETTINNEIKKENTNEKVKIIKILSNYIPVMIIIIEFLIPNIMELDIMQYTINSGIIFVTYILIIPILIIILSVNNFVGTKKIGQLLIYNLNLIISIVLCLNIGILYGSSSFEKIIMFSIFGIIEIIPLIMISGIFILMRLIQRIELRVIKQEKTEENNKIFTQHNMLAIVLILVSLTNLIVESTRSIPESSDFFLAYITYSIIYIFSIIVYIRMVILSIMEFKKNNNVLNIMIDIGIVVIFILIKISPLIVL